MVHALLFAAGLLFVLWMFGLGGAWAAHVTWTLFIVACGLVAIWALASIALRAGRHDRPLHS